MIGELTHFAPGGIHPAALLILASTIARFDGWQVVRSPCSRRVVAS
jgi:hypothetical protein